MGRVGSSVGDRAPWGSCGEEVLMLPKVSKEPGQPEETTWLGQGGGRVRLPHLAKWRPSLLFFLCHRCAFLSLSSATSLTSPGSLSLPS